MMVPARIAATFEVIEAQLALQMAILDFDGPTTASDAYERLERRGRRQVAEVILPLVVDQGFLTEQPALAATLRYADADGCKASLERAFGARSPSDPVPRGRREAVGDRGERLGRQGRDQTGAH